jgi:hypothetical protein
MFVFFVLAAVHTREKLGCGRDSRNSWRAKTAAENVFFLLPSKKTDGQTGKKKSDRTDKTISYVRYATTFFFISFQKKIG